MKLRDRFKRFFTNDSDASADLNSEELLQWLGIDVKNKGAIHEATYYTCIKMLAETIGKLPLKYYQMSDKGRIRAAPTQATRLMTVRPNPYMTPTTMWSTTEMNTQHYGNGYIWLRRVFVPQKYGGAYGIMDMWPMQSECVTPYIDDVGIFGQLNALYYKYSDPRTGKQYMFKNGDVLHFKTWCSWDGIMGKSVREILKETVDGASSNQGYMNNLYKNGLTASMAMQYVGDLDEQKRKLLQRKFADQMSGPENAGKIIPVPAGLTLTPLKMTLADAQFFELKKYSALQIAGAFGIKPNQINDYDKSSYASSEAQQLAFLVDTMLYRLKGYEEEINAKVLTDEEIRQQFFYKFNEKAILRTDSKTQMECLKDGVNNAIYTPNEARDLLDKPAAEGGDILMCNGNYIPITQVAEKGGANGTN